MSKKDAKKDTKNQTGSDDKDDRFSGFYLSLLPRQELLEDMIHSFYLKLIRHIGLFRTDKVFAKSETEPENLTEELFTKKYTGAPNPFVMEYPRDFTLLRGDYAKLFRDGYLFYRILHFVMLELGMSSDEIKEQSVKYRGHKMTKTYLRACYWFICNKFVLKLPAEFQVSFYVDCLLYGEWSLHHPNVVVLHLLALTWMMGVEDFKIFLPKQLKDCPIVKKPPFEDYKPAHSIKLDVREDLWKLASFTRKEWAMQQALGKREDATVGAKAATTDGSDNSQRRAR